MEDCDVGIKAGRKRWDIIGVQSCYNLLLHNCIYLDEHGLLFYLE